MGHLGRICSSIDADLDGWSINVRSADDGGPPRGAIRGIVLAGVPRTVTVELVRDTFSAILKPRLTLLAGVANNLPSMASAYPRMVVVPNPDDGIRVVKLAGFACMRCREECDRL